MTTLVRRLRLAAIVLAAALLLSTALAWLALPALLQSQLPAWVAEKSGHALSFARPEINPLALSLRLREFKLADPEGMPLLSFGELFVDLSAASIPLRGAVIEELRVDGLAAELVVGDGPRGPLNWSRLLAAFAERQETPQQAPPRFEIRRLAVSGARVSIADRRGAAPFESRIEALDFELRDLSTQPGDSGDFRLAAKTAFGATIEWQGSATLSPLASSGRFALRDADLGKLAPLLAARLPPNLGLAPPRGIATLTVDYRLGHADGKPTLTLDPFAVELTGLALARPQAAGAPALTVGAARLAGGRFDLAGPQLAFESLTLNDTFLAAGTARKPLVVLPGLRLGPARVDLGQRVAELGSLGLEGGRITLRRDESGIDLVATLQGLAPTATATQPAAAPVATDPAWRFALARVTLGGFAVAFEDATLDPPLRVGLEEIGVGIDGISDRLDRPLAVKAALRVASGGSLAIEGRVTPATAAADLKLRLDGLALAPAQPFIGRLAALELAGGRIGAAGSLHHDARESRFHGSLAIDGLALREAGTDKLFLGWKALSTAQFEVTPQRLQIGELLLDGLDTQLLIARDKSTNFQRILRRGDPPPQAGPDAAGVAAAVPPAPTPAPATTEAAPAPAFLVSIDRLRLRDGELEFADESLLFPFGTRIHKLRGSVAGLSTRPGAPGQLELEGQVDDFGLARAVGQIDPFDPTGYTEVKASFRNLEMTRLTPYSATFAGRRIDSGKLSLELEYNIRKRRLDSHNQVVIDRLVLGERVQSPSAKDLPLDLAIALLEDSDGRIDLGLPVSGSLDDPQFSYGAIVWKVIGNVLTKIVTAPFRALGALFGGGDEKLESVAFEAGSRRPTPPEREKLVKLAAALNKRPALALTIAGTWNDADRVALQDRQLRRTLLEASGQKIDPQGDPGPIATRAPAMQAAIEGLFGERFGKAELEGFKQGFRAANPGQMEEGVGGRMMSRLTGLVRPPRQLSESEVGALKGADFHAALYQRLREKEVVPDERLQQLAGARAESALGSLRDAKAPAERVTLGAPQRIEGDAAEVALKLDLGRAK